MSKYQDFLDDRGIGVIKIRWRRVTDRKKVWAMAEQTALAYGVALCTVKVLEFYLSSPKSGWRMYFVGINFDRGHIRDGHYAGLPYRFVDLVTFKPKK